MAREHHRREVERVTGVDGDPDLMRRSVRRERFLQTHHLTISTLALDQVEAERMSETDRDVERDEVDE